MQISHYIQPGYEAARLDVVEGETITAFLERNDLRFKLPTICVYNAVPVMRKDWATTTISSSDKVSFVSKPHGGGGSGGGKATQVLGLVALVALSAFAPWAAGSLFAAGTFGFYATVTAITLGGGLLISSFMKPEAPATNTDPIPQIYSLTGAGNTANPLQVRPVQYGTLKVEPPYASIPWSEYIGDDAYLNITLNNGEGKYQKHQILIDDTILWDENTGLNPSFTGVSWQFCNPGEPLTLFPSNVVTAAEVNGQEIESTFLGGFIANTAGTLANRLVFDIVFPAGLFRLEEGETATFPNSRVFVGEIRQVDSLGSPIGGWLAAVSQTVQFATRQPKRISFEVNLATAGRYEARLRATTDTNEDPNYIDQAQWVSLRAFLEGSNVFPSSVTGIRIKATAQLSQNSAKKFGIIQTRILPVWNGSTFVEQATQNPFWALYDCATNSYYGAGRPVNKMDFQAIVDQANAANTRGDTFNYVFDAQVTFASAFDLILSSARSKHTWLGDVLSVTRDEWKPIPQMLLGDQQTVRGSMTIDYILNDEDNSDSVTATFLNEETWQPAQLQYPPNTDEFTSLKPAAVQLQGVTNPEHLFRELKFLYRQSQLRRIRISLDTEHDGRLLRFGSAVKVQSHLPRKWGVSGEIVAYNPGTKILTLDREIGSVFGEHYIEIRNKTGGYFGPVLVDYVIGQPKQLRLDEDDLADVEADIGETIDSALDRMDGAEPPSFVFGMANELSRHCIVLSGKPTDDKVTLELTIDSEEVHDAEAEDVPVQPVPPVLTDPRVPLISGLTANFKQDVVTPTLHATWWPSSGALYYKAQVSYDEGESWTTVADGLTEPNLSLAMSPTALRLRVSAIGVLQGPWSQVDIAAPTLINPFPVGVEDLQAGLHDYVMNNLNQGLDRLSLVAQQIAAIAAEQDAAGATADQGIRKTQILISNDTMAMVEELSTTIANDQEAFAAYQVTVSATINDIEASVATNATTIANDQVAFAAYQVTVSATINDIEASVATNATAIANTEGFVTAMYSLTLDVNGYVSGFQSVNDGASAVFGILADYFYVAKPGVTGGTAIPVFAINTVNGSAKLALRGDMYADGSITARSISVTSLSALSGTMGTLTTGKIESPDGKFLIDATNKRIVISD